MKKEVVLIHQANVDNSILRKALKLLKQVRNRIVPEQTPPEYDPRESALQKASNFARYLHDHQKNQYAEKTFTQDEVIDFGKIARTVPVALRFDVNLLPEVTSYSLRDYNFLILVWENNTHYLFYPFNISPSTEDDGFIFRVDIGEGVVGMKDMTEAFGSELEVFNFGRMYWACLSDGEATDIDDTKRVDLISAGYSQKQEAKVPLDEPLGFPAWQT